MTVIHILIRTRKRSKLWFDSECFALKQQVRDQYTVVKSWDSRAARDNIAFLVKDFQPLKRQNKEQFDVGQEIIAIERIEGETNALWGMWMSSSASGSRLSVSPVFWLSQFSTLYHSPRPICLPRSLTGPPDAFLDRAFSTTDVLRAVSRGANGKASGPDRLTNECLEDALGVLIVPLTNVFNFYFSHGCCPPQWCHPVVLFSRKLDRVAPNKLTEPGCINYHICLNYNKRIVRGQVKQRFILSTDCAICSGRFCSSDSTLFRAFIIYFVCGGFQLSNPESNRYLYTVRY